MSLHILVCGYGGSKAALSGGWYRDRISYWPGAGI